MGTSTSVRKPLGVRATPEQHRLLSEAAAREHRSLSGFVLQAALQVAESKQAAKPRRSREEIMAIVHAAQEEARSANPTGRDILEELIHERRREAASE